MAYETVLNKGVVDLSIVFVTYNRSDLLAKTFNAIVSRAKFNRMRVELIAADDASSPEHLIRIAALPFHKRILVERNTGLGANQNRGIASSSAELIFQIQDDCEYIGSPHLILDAIDIFEASPDVGIVQFVDSTPSIEHEIRVLPSGLKYRVFVNDQIDQDRPCHLRPYSDQPHLKRRSFCSEIGPYRENVPMTIMELDYKRRVACQTTWRVAAIVDVQAFEHVGAERTFNPSVLRARRMTRAETLPYIGPAIRMARPVARKIRDFCKRVLA